MGGAPSATWFDPLALCRESGDSERGFFETYETGHQGHERGAPRVREEPFAARQAAEAAVAASAAAAAARDEEELQKVILLSLQEQPQEDDDLQEALHISCLEAAGIIEAPQPPPEDSEAVRMLEDFLDGLGLARLDVGSTNLSEGGNILSNQCFYLAIARSWLADAASMGGMLVRDSALQLKREIEDCVMRVRGAEVGEEQEAYADYLECAMRKEEAGGGTATDLAIAVFASCAGGVEAYEGSGYASLPREQRVANLSLIWHRPGHFEAVVAEGGGKADITLDELLLLANQSDIATACLKA